MIETVVTTVVPFFMFTLMFGMGLSLTTSDFKRVLIFPKATLIGLFLQLMILPAIGFALAYIFELSAMLAVGLVAIAACPGGSTSNMVVHMGKGDTALSITLTATATAVTLFTLPVWISYTLAFFGGADSAVEMPILRTAAQLSLFTVVPVGLGMFMRKYSPILATKEAIISKVSTLAVIIAFLSAGFMEGERILGGAGLVVIPSLLFVLAAVVLGYTIPRLSGVSKKDSSTIAVETTLKNVLLSLFLATNSLNSMEAAYSTGVLMLVMMPVAAGVMVAFNHSNREKKEIEKISVY